MSEKKPMPADDPDDIHPIIQEGVIVDVHKYKAWIDSLAPKGAPTMTSSSEHSQDNVERLRPRRDAKSNWNETPPPDYYKKPDNFTLETAIKFCTEYYEKLAPNDMYKYDLRHKHIIFDDYFIKTYALTAFIRSRQGVKLTLDAGGKVWVVRPRDESGRGPSGS
jgi:hypothetical protein